MRDPGLDRHEWEGEWESLESDLNDAPRETLPQLDDLVGRMLEGHGVVVEGDDVSDEGAEAEIVRSRHAAHEVAARVDRGEDVDPGDVGYAVERLREIYTHLLAQPHE